MRVPGGLTRAAAGHSHAVRGPGTLRKPRAALVPGAGCRAKLRRNGNRPCCKSLRQGRFPFRVASGGRLRFRRGDPSSIGRGERQGCGNRACPRVGSERMRGRPLGVPDGAALRGSAPFSACGGPFPESGALFSGRGGPDGPCVRRVRRFPAVLGTRALVSDMRSGSVPGRAGRMCTEGQTAAGAVLTTATSWVTGAILPSMRMVPQYFSCARFTARPTRAWSRSDETSRL